MMRWVRLWRVCGRDLRLLVYALRHPLRPVWLWPAVVLVAAYALEPFNFAIPLLGVVDELLIVPLLLHGLLQLLPRQLRGGFEGAPPDYRAA